MFIHHKVVNIKDRKRQTTCIQREKSYNIVQHNTEIASRVIQNIMQEVVWEIDWYQNEWPSPWPLFRGRLRSGEPIASHSPLNILETVKDRALVPRTVNRKWSMRNQMVTWPMTYVTLKGQVVTPICLVHCRENSWRCHLATIAIITRYSAVTQYNGTAILATAWLLVYFKPKRPVHLDLCHPPPPPSSSFIPSHTLSPFLRPLRPRFPSRSSPKGSGEHCKLPIAGLDRVRPTNTFWCIRW